VDKLINFVTTHIMGMDSRRKSAQRDYKTTHGRKGLDSSVKPQNMGVSQDRPQCPIFRQTAARSLIVGHFDCDRLLIHRVIHRSCGTNLLKNLAVRYEGQ
jgi:hypothetical protein